jgi:hypothetical protein
VIEADPSELSDAELGSEIRDLTKTIAAKTSLASFRCSDVP